MKNDKMSIDEIITLGEKIKQFNKDSVNLSVYISNSIGKTKKPTKTMHRIDDLFGKLRHELEVELWKRIENELINPTSCFYGSNKPIKKGE